MKPEDLLSAFRQAQLTLSVAESCTGGLLAAALTEPAGASDVFLGGVISYSNDAKHTSLNVDVQTLQKHGAVSEQVADQMASGAQARFSSDVAIAITGIAGPGPSEHKPEGRVCFAVAAGEGPNFRETIEFGAIGRSQVRAASVDHALKMLANVIRRSHSI